MAAMNFPANPTVGQEYVWSPFTYVWDGEKWTTKVDVDPEGYVKRSGDTMTGPLTIVGTDTAKLFFSDDAGTDLTILHDGFYTAFRDGETGPDLLALIGGSTPKVDLRNPVSLTPQGIEVNALTRKDYVDAVVLSAREEIAELREQLAELQALLAGGITVL